MPYFFNSVLQTNPHHSLVREEVLILGGSIRASNVDEEKTTAPPNSCNGVMPHKWHPVQQASMSSSSGAETQIATRKRLTCFVSKRRMNLGNVHHQRRQTEKPQDAESYIKK
uniref:Uncharacterized protein n=1 Tax=Trichobilharzia regenti TaxID=157069 RepID=A0AA85JGX4_TRIRE|nr:unnamed protein product [Trichobilharzia regenti]